VEEVHFQTEHLGWNTDDFLIVCERPGLVVQKLVGQVKRSFTVSATDDECKKAIQDFWKDYKKPDQFCPTNDRLLLVTLRGTNTLLEHFVGLRTVPAQLGTGRNSSTGWRRKGLSRTRQFIAATNYVKS